MKKLSSVLLDNLIRKDIYSLLWAFWKNELMRNDIVGNAYLPKNPDPIVSRSSIFYDNGKLMFFACVYLIYRWKYLGHVSIYETVSHI